MCDYPENDVSEVIPNLWLGNVKAAYNKNFLEKYKIKNILTIMDNFDNNKKFNTIKYLIIPIKDKHSCNTNMIKIFDISTLFIYNSLKNNEGILVHCKQGHHRSASLVVAFLIKYLKTDYQRALQYIKYLRPCAVRRNTCMSNNLFTYYLHINNIQSCDVKCGVDNNIYSCKCSTNF